MNCVNIRRSGEQIFFWGKVFLCSFFRSILGRCFYPCFIKGRIVRFVKGIVHQFWIYNIFFVPHRKKHFLWKVHLDKTTLTRNNWEKRVHKVSPFYIYDIYNSTRSDWLCAPYFLNYFESEWFYRDEPFIKNVSFGGARKKCYIFKIGEQSL